MRDTSYNGGSSCRLCDIYKEADDPEIREKTDRLIRAMDPKEKADEALYAKRLDICGECELLTASTCRACGCYVELRAVKKEGACPHRKW